MDERNACDKYCTVANESLSQIQLPASGILDHALGTWYLLKPLACYQEAKQEDYMPSTGPSLATGIPDALELMKLDTAAHPR